MGIVRVLLALALLTLLPTWALAEGPSDEAKARLAALDLNQTVVKVVELAQAGDEASLRILADRDSPDPWIVVAHLAARDAHDAALAFARSATPRAPNAKLAAYVAHRRALTVDPKAWHALAAMADLDPLKGLAASPRPRVSAETVIGMLILEQEAKLYELGDDVRPALEAYLTAAQNAARIGWIHQAGLYFFGACLHLRTLGEEEKATAAAKECLKHWAQSDFPLGIGIISSELAGSARAQGQNLAAVGYYERALRAFGMTADSRKVVTVLAELGLVCAEVGLRQKALGYLQRALPLYRSLDVPAGWSGVNLNIGLVYGALGSYAKAIEHYTEGVRAARAIKHAEFEGNGLLNLAGVYWRIGDHEQALSFTELAFAKMKAAGRPQDLVHAQIGLGILRRELGDPEGSRQLLVAARAQAELLDADEIHLNATINLGDTLLELGSVDEAIALFESSLVRQRYFWATSAASRTRL